MVPSNDLFELIKSLTAQEKKFLTSQFAYTEGDENTYKKLYDAIERQSEYDELKIKKKFSKTINERSFPVIKNRLFHFILDSLRVSYANDLPDFSVRQMIEKATILNEKKLRDAAWKLTLKAKQEALLNELFPEALRALEIERKNIFFQAQEHYDRLLKENTLEEKDTVEKLKNLTAYEDLQSKMFSIYRANLSVRNKEDAAFLNEMIRHSLLQDATTALSFRAKYHFYIISATCYRYLGDLEKGFTYIQKLASMIETAPMLHNRLMMYLNVLPEMAVIQASLGKFADALVIVQKIRELGRSYPQFVKSIAPAMIFRKIAITETDLYIRIPDYEAGAAQLSRIEDELKKYHSVLPQYGHYILYYNIGLLYFGTGDCHNALHWLNRILNENKDEYVLDLTCAARMLFLIIHLELGNDDLLEYAAQSTQRYLTTRKRKYKVETVFLELLHLILNPDRKKELHSIYPQMLAQLKSLRSDPYEKGAFEHFDFVSWCESRIQNCTFGEIVKEKAKLLL